ncbi:MAG: penicillin-binding protein activator [Pseudomonadota bacterium]
MYNDANLHRRKCLGMLAAAPVVAACAPATTSARRMPNEKADARVALLFPLSGARAALGQQMAKAVWLVEDYGGTTERTMMLDAGETPQAAAQAARDAVAKGANMIVGPLFRDQTPAVVEAAGPVPVMSLSNDIALSAAGAWVFGVTPAQSVNAVLGFAKDTGAKRITILETGGALGHRAFQALHSGARGAPVALLASIPATTRPNDMSDALRQAGNGSMPDIIYVPEAGAMALRQAEASVQTGVTTIGSLQWSGLGQAQLDRLDKACFTGPNPVRFDQLSSFFRAQLDEEMGVIAALAVDAVGLAQSVGGARTLSARSSYQGLLGDTRFDRDKTCKRALAILRIEDGAVRPVL